ncbi:unnamed protein product [Ilex paraguariensis]|uniref:Uncharacterized protein n=1 Tax=Ilex paraguariensis TaxID=185542 RepID=A0ABC8TY26_9AQUA
MAKLLQLSLTILFALLLVQHTLCADPPEFSPTPPPQLGAGSHSLPPDASPSHSPSPAVSSPPAPPPSGLTPAHSPANSPSEKTPPPAPSSVPEVAGDIGRNDVNANADGSEKSHGGLSGGQKAGIVIGVLAAACMVGLGCILYRKRQQNIQRSQYGYAARREIL